MRGSTGLPALIAATLVLCACGVDTPAGPDVERTPLRPVPPATSEPLSVFTVTPSDFTIDIGDEVQLIINVRNSRGFVLPFPPISYSTSDSEIATVSSGGLVRAKAVGTAVISAKTTTGSATYLTSATITVRQPQVFEGLVLKAQSGGWEPRTGHVAAGGKVQWQSGVIAVSGRPVEALYLLDEGYGIIGSLTFTNGVAEKTFATRGTYKYCSNACWDPPEFGTIVVH